MMSPMNGIINAQCLLLIFNWLITSISFLVIYYDFRYWRIPNFLVISITVFSLLKVGIDYQYLSIINDLVFPIIFLVLLLFLLTRIYPHGLGAGDIKYIIALSIYFNWWIFPILWLSSLTGLVHFGFLKLLNTKCDRIPFGVHLGIFTIIFLILT